MLFAEKIKILRDEKELEEEVLAVSNNKIRNK